MTIPAKPKIYHIVHVDRLASIVSDGCLRSDAAIVGRQGTGTTIGMGAIKQRRLGLPVSCHQGLFVGDCVPFYFCSRSVMLYVIHCRNHPALTYRDGQEPIVHLEADLAAAVRWAEVNGKRWAFALSNAGANYAQFRAQLAELGDVNWVAVQSTDFRSTDVKEGKQAEFLVEQAFPWTHVERIGVISQGIGQKVSDAIQGAKHRPRIEIRRDWYF